MNLILSATAFRKILFEELCDTLESLRMDFIAFGPTALQWNRRVNNGDRIAEPAAEALHFSDDFDVLIPVNPRRHRPHHLALVKHVDIVVHDDSELQIGHLDKRLHAGLVRLVFELFLDRDIGNAAPGARRWQMNGFDAGDVFFDDIVNASFLGDASEIPMIHVARPEVFDDAVAPVGDGGHLDDRHLHLHLVITQNFAEGVLRVANMRRYFTFDDHFGVGRYEKFIAPRCRWREPQRLP